MLTIICYTDTNNHQYFIIAVKRIFYNNLIRSIVLYGTWLCGALLSPSLGMTFPKANKFWLLLPLSLSIFANIHALLPFSGPSLENGVFYICLCTE